jgi:RHS repeat-associated protein
VWWAALFGSTLAHADGLMDPALCGSAHFTPSTPTYQDAQLTCEAAVEELLAWNKDPSQPNVSISQACEMEEAATRSYDWLQGELVTRYSTTSKRPPPDGRPVKPIERRRADNFTCKPVQLGGDEAGETPADVDKSTGEAPAGNDVGDPIDTATGQVYRHERDTDVGAWLRFERSYTSGARTDGVLGLRWTHNYARSLQWLPPTLARPMMLVRLTREDGKVQTFRYIARRWQAEADDGTTLTWKATGDNEPRGFTLLRPDARTHETYNARGQLTQITQPDGQVLTLAYTDTCLTRISEPSGRALTLTCDGSGRLASLVTPNGETVQYRYDDHGALAEVSYPGGGTRRYRYDEAAFSAAEPALLLTGILDGAGTRLASYTYQADGRATVTELAGGTQRFALRYHDDGSVTTTDPYGQAVTRTYTAVAGVPRVSTVSAPCQSCDGVAGWTYTAQGLPAEQRGFDGQRTTFGYDAQWHETLRVEAAGTADERRWVTAWTDTDDVHVRMALPPLRELRDAQGKPLQRWRYGYDGSLTHRPSVYCEIDPVQAPNYSCDNLDFMPPPAGVRRTRFMYCMGAVPTLGCPWAGVLQIAMTPEGMTNYSYYTDTQTSGCDTPGGACHHVGDLKAIRGGTLFAEQMAVLSYDRNGRPTRVRDARGTLTDTFYGPRGWVRETIVRARGDGAEDATDAVTRYSYDDDGRLLTQTDPDGVTLTYGYDAGYRRVTVTDAAGQTVKRTLDGAGQVRSEQIVDSTGTVQRRWQHHYDTIGQLARLTDGLDQPLLRDARYDATGLLQESRDALGHLQQWRYDARHRPIAYVADAQSRKAETLYAYDAADRIEGVADPDGLSTTYDHDGLGQRTGLHSPDSGDTRSSYDDAGRLATLTDAKGVTRNYTYDGNSRLTQLSFSDGTPTRRFLYDEMDWFTDCQGSVGQNQLTRSVVGAVTTTYCYDRRGHVLEKRQTQGDGEAAVTDRLRYAYTPAGRIRRIEQPSGSVLDITYDGAGRIASLIATPPGGAATLIVSGVTYRADGSVAGYQLGNGQTVTRQFDANGRITAIDSGALKLSYEYDPAGQITAITEAGERYRYAYDTLGRLIDVIDPQGRSRQQFSYNGTGDRLTKTGNGDATGVYGYQDGTHRLVRTGEQIRQVDAVGSTTARQDDGGQLQLTYDAEQQLTGLTRNGQPHAQYTYNAHGERIAKTVRLPVPLSARYVYNEASQLVAELGGRTRDYVWLGDLPVAVIDHASSNATIHYVHADHLGTPRAITDGARETIWTWKLAGDPFGEVAPQTQGYAYALRFPGQYVDAESGLHYNVHRYYDAHTGRYTTTDPLGLEAGLSTYGYVSGNPLALYDPYGLWAWGDPLPQGLVDFTAGLGDDISFGLTGLAREQLGTNGAVNECSASYKTGNYASILSPGGFAKKGGKLAVKQVGRLGSPAMQQHHLLPRQFKNFFSGRGINIDDHTINLGATSHLKGMHGNGLGNMRG